MNLYTFALCASPLPRGAECASYSRSHAGHAPASIEQNEVTSDLVHVGIKVKRRRKNLLNIL